MSNDINVLDAFAGGEDFSLLVTDPSSIMTTGKTTTLQKGRRVPFQATFSGMSYPGYVTLQSANLHRVSIIDHFSVKQNRHSKLVTGIFKPVKMSVEMVFDGEMITLENLLRRVANRNLPENLQATEEQFAATLENLGMRFTSGMNLFWQQFGANPEGIAKLVDTFKAAGAIDAMHLLKTSTDRIKECYQMPSDNTVDRVGPEVVSFELSRSDRSQSMAGQGFLDLVDSTTENYKRIFKLRKEAHLIRQSINSKAISENWSQERISGAKKDIDALNRLSQQWATTWSGAQQRTTVDKKDPNIKKLEPTFDPTHAPCGRFSLVVNNEIVAIDLWTNSVRSNTSDAGKVPAPQSETVANLMANWNTDEA